MRLEAGCCFRLDEAWWNLKLTLHALRNNSGNVEETMGSERFKPCLTDEHVGECNLLIESEGENRLRIPPLLS